MGDRLFRHRVRKAGAPIGLRRRWRIAFVSVGLVVLLAVAGATLTYDQTASRFRSAASHLDQAISRTSALNAAINAHEIESHKLWQGSAIDRPAYLRGQSQIEALFRSSLRELRGPGEHALLLRAQRVWSTELQKRGLWGAGASARPGGVTADMQAAYGSAQDQVYFTLGRLSLTAISNGTHDLTAAERFQVIGVGLLVGVFALTLAVMGYFARRLTADVVLPILSLRAGVRSLAGGSLADRVELPGSPHPNEVDELASSFNEMAAALEKTHLELERRASLDDLTGLANRAVFNARLDELVDGADPSSSTLNVLFVDLDDFKFVNDSIGHAAGDELLENVARRLSACARPTDLVARLGGDEFAIIVLSDSPERDSADLVATRILEAFTTPFALADRSAAVGVSIGVSTMHAGTPDAASLIAEADYAMYTAKRAGKGQSSAFDATVA